MDSIVMRKKVTFPHLGSHSFCSQLVLLFFLVCVCEAKHILYVCMALARVHSPSHYHCYDTKGETEQVERMEIAGTTAKS